MRKAACICVIITFTPFFLCSCAHVKSSQRDMSVVIPESYAIATKGEAYEDCWWMVFEDKKLNLLVSEALGSNLGLQQVRSRLEQVQAIARKAGAEYIPQVSIDGGVMRTRSRQVDVMGAKSVHTASQFGLNMAASYEIDLWGRVSATKRAAIFDAKMARDNLGTASMTLVAQITDLWYQIAAFRERITLLQAQIKSSEEQSELLELRFDTGQVTAVDVWQQREQLAAIRTLLPGLEAVSATSSHQLAVLLGRPPQMTADLVPSDLPEIPSLPDIGVPVDLLRKRPDVQASMNRLHAENERVSVALADRLPALRLTAAAGYSAPNSGDLFDDWLGNIAGNLLAPVLDGGRRKAEIDRTHAVVREQLASCGEVLLGAMREVEDALVNETKQKEMVKRQTEQHEAAFQTLQQARSRYNRGLDNYVYVLNAQVREQTVARALIVTRHEQLRYRIQLYRSLGGHWMRFESGQEEK